MKDTQFAINEADVVAEVIDGEAILINMTTGCYYSLDGSACEIWKLLQMSPANAQSLASSFSGDHEHIVTEVKTFLNSLSEENLIQPSENHSNSLNEAHERSQLSHLVLNKYTDMENLMLMDPIHDVSDEGWPTRQN